MIILDNIEFKNHKAILAYIRKIRDMYPKGQFLNTSDFRIMKAAVALSDKFDNRPEIIKINFELVPDLRSKFKGLYCHFSDGKKDNISMANLHPNYRSRDKEKEYDRDIIQSFRFHIIDWKDNLKEKAIEDFGINRICKVTGNKVHIDDCVVHHEPSFKSIANDFLNRFYSQNPDLKIEIHRPCGVQFQLKNDNLRNTWIKFHNKKAKGVVLTTAEHKHEHRLIKEQMEANDD